VGEGGEGGAAGARVEEEGVRGEVAEYGRDRAGDGELRDVGREGAGALGLSTDEVFKTLVVVGETDEMIVAVLPVSCQLCMKRVDAAAGLNKVSVCELALAERASGYVVGGISPLGQRRRLRNVFDESAELFDKVYVSGGRRGLDLGLSPTDLIGVLGAVVAPITA